MSDQPMDQGPANDVRLRGRVSGTPIEKVLPSGDVLWLARVVVDRPRRPGTPRRMVDTIDCVARTARSRRSVSRWADGDQVEVNGSLRRRFFRNGTRAESRCEVEIVSARRARRPARA